MNRFIVILVSGIMFGCNWLDEALPYQSHIEDPVKAYKIQKDIKYGKEPLQGFDLYLPVSEYSNPAEILFLIHGGAWYSGDKSWLNPTVDSLLFAKKNLAIVNLNYRLLPGKSNLLSTQLADIDSCVNFVLRKAASYNIRNKIVIAGISAGGHLALMHAYTRNDTRAVVGVSAYTELSDRQFMDKSLRVNVEFLIGQKYGDSLNIFRNASPLYIVSPSAPATVLLYGGADVTTTHQHGRLLMAKLQALNIPNSYTLFHGEDHNISAKEVARSILGVFGTKKSLTYSKK